ncbi:hypothetical protein BDV11DRAFT_187506 [Aspergillus similis]
MLDVCCLPICDMTRCNLITGTLGGGGELRLPERAMMLDATHSRIARGICEQIPPCLYLISFAYILYLLNGRVCNTF